MILFKWWLVKLELENGALFDSKLYFTLTNIPESQNASHDKIAQSRQYEKKKTSNQNKVVN